MSAKKTDNQSTQYFFPRNTRFSNAQRRWFNARWMLSSNGIGRHTLKTLTKYTKVDRASIEVVGSYEADYSTDNNNKVTACGGGTQARGGRYFQMGGRNANTNTFRNNIKTHPFNNVTVDNFLWERFADQTYGGMGGSDAKTTTMMGGTIKHLSPFVNVAWLRIFYNRIQTDPIKQIYYPQMTQSSAKGSAYNDSVHLFAAIGQLTNQNSTTMSERVDKVNINYWRSITAFVDRTSAKQGGNTGCNERWGIFAGGGVYNGGVFPGEHWQAGTIISTIERWDNKGAAGQTLVAFGDLVDENDVVTAGFGSSTGCSQKRMLMSNHNPVTGGTAVGPMNPIWQYVDFGILSDGQVYYENDTEEPHNRAGYAGT